MVLAENDLIRWLVTTDFSLHGILVFGIVTIGMVIILFCLYIGIQENIKIKNNKTVRKIGFKY